MTLEDAMADIADLGATGVEILGEGNITGHPAPTSAWIGRWFRLLEKYALTPTSFGSWIDTRMWTERDLTVGEGQDQLAQDLRLASLLGFGYVRPKFGVVMLDLIPHPMWEEVVLRNLQLAADLDIVICPEIHSPTPLRHKVTESYVDLIERTCSNHFKLLIDTGIFQTEPVDEGHPGFAGQRPPAPSRTFAGAADRPARRDRPRRVLPDEVLRGRRRPGRPRTFHGRRSSRYCTRAGGAAGSPVSTKAARALSRPAAAAPAARPDPVSGRPERQPARIRSSTATNV
jgi:hypothetical protein